MLKTDTEILKFLEMCAEMELKEVAEKLGVTTNAVWQRLARSRKRIVNYQNFLNNVRSLQRRNPRFRKLTTMGTLETEEDEFIE